MAAWWRRRSWRRWRRRMGGDGGEIQDAGVLSLAKQSGWRRGDVNRGVEIELHDVVLARFAIGEVFDLCSLHEIAGVV